LARRFEASILTPAKLNLFLRITGVRNDGYHNLFSLFVPVTLFDEIKIRKDRKISGEFAGYDFPFEKSSVFRAATLFFSATGIRSGCYIRVKKEIPAGAGLGGGSSDAAAVLKLLNLLYGYPLTRSDLLALASKAGADVPFFILSRPSLVEGVGDIIHEFEMPLKIWFVVIYPGFESSTPEIYREYDNLTEKNQNIKIKQNFDWRGLLGENDLEKPFLKVYSEGNEVRKMIESTGGFDFYGLTGSGSSWYVAFFNRKRRDEFQKRFWRVCKPHWQCFSVNIF